MDIEEPNYFTFRKQVATELINSYINSGAQFAYATNSNEDPTKPISLTTNGTEVLNAINSQEVVPVNSTVDLYGALSFFDGQNFSSSTSDGYSVSYIFYITHHRLHFVKIIIST